MKPLFLFMIAVLLAQVTFARVEKRHRVYKKPWEKDNIHLDVSVLMANQFYFRPPGADLGTGGFWGVSAGGDYCYRRNRFLSLQVGTAINYVLPVPAGVDVRPDSAGHLYTDQINTTFINVRNNYVWRRWDFGYGLMASRHDRTETDSYSNSKRTMDSVLTRNYTNMGLGASLAAYYRWNWFFYMGILYQPQALSIQNGVQWKYEHFISLDVLFRLGIYNSSRHHKTKAHRAQSPITHPN